eukprot:scaffold8385_cov267-Pinguiococcus_pyrenoidosus.AAC.1
MCSARMNGDPGADGSSESEDSDVVYEDVLSLSDMNHAMLSSHSAQSSFSGFESTAGPAQSSFRGLASTLVPLAASAAAWHQEDKRAYEKSAPPSSSHSSQPAPVSEEVDSPASSAGAFIPSFLWSRIASSGTAELGVARAAMLRELRVCATILGDRR